ncbi:MAG: tetratricopeptide repeat protein [Phycisphaerae bacterium]|nr:tetratricopeptide repeat protein [Phycisphaerae bacterium]
MVFRTGQSLVGWVDGFETIGDNYPMQNPPDNKLPNTRGTASAPPTDNLAARAEPRFRPMWLVIAVFTLALLVRGVYLYQIRTIPFLEHPSVDARSYDEWAQRIAGGQWWGDEVFYQAPAYPYFLAVLYRLGGHHLWLVRGVQIVLGAFSCVLICLAGRRFLGHGAGVVSGVLLALYPPAIFFDGLIQKAALGLFLAALLLYLLSRTQQHMRATTCAACGLVTGLLALTRENTLLFAGVIPIWMFVRFAGQTYRRRAGLIGLFVGGVALALIPVGLRNFSVGGAFVLTTSQLGTNFYIGNNARADGLYAPLVAGRSNPVYERRDAVELAERAVGRTLTPVEVSHYWLDRGWRFVRQDTPAWLRLMVRKWSLVWNHFEVPDAEDMYAYGDWSHLLRALGWVLHFGVLVPLAAAGVVLWWPHRRDLWVLHLLVLAVSGSVTLFYVFGRYRFPLVPLLVLFAGGACVEGYRHWRVRRLRPLVVALVLAVIIALWVNRAILPEAYYRSISYSNLGAICARNGRQADAERYLAKALSMYPQSASALRHMGHLRAGQGRNAESHYYLGMASAQMNDPLSAARHYQLAVQANPNLLQAHYNLGAVLAHLGRYPEAIAAMERCLEVALATGKTDHLELIRDRLSQYRAQPERRVEPALQR